MGRVSFGGIGTWATGWGCLRRAVEQLRAMQDLRFLDAPALTRPSPGSGRPAGRRDAGCFFNCAVVIETDLPPATLLARLQAVEEAWAAAARGHAGGPALRARPLDIDILLYDDRVISGPEHLHIPAPAHARAPVRAASSGRSRSRPGAPGTLPDHPGAAGRAGDEHEVRESTCPAGGSTTSVTLPPPPCPLPRPVADDEFGSRPCSTWTPFTTWPST